MLAMEVIEKFYLWVYKVLVTSLASVMEGRYCTPTNSAFEAVALVEMIHGAST
jgi:hypothetical protein